MTERMIKSGDVDICTEAFGDESDTPILLIMGASTSMLMWPEELCERLAAAGRFVIRYDNRDTGLSTHYPLGEPEYTVEDMADDTVAVLDAYDIDTAHIVGASMGGMITQQAALRHRDRVRTITPIMSTPDPGAVVGVLSGEDASSALPGPKPELLAAALAQAGVDPNDKQAVIDSRVASLGCCTGLRTPTTKPPCATSSPARSSATRNFQSSANHQVPIRKTPAWRSQLASLDVPTLVIHGTADPILPYEHGVVLAKDIAGAELLTMEGVGHELPGEEMDAIVPAILRHTQS